MKVIIAAAGTGGHINPGIAIANKIKEKEPDSEIIFVGTERGIENDLVPRAGYKLKTVEAYGISKKISIETLKRNIKTLKGFGQAKKIVKEFNPDIVIGTGGYICGGALLSASKLGIPTMIHESNAYPGKATKFLEKKLTKILLGFKDAEDYFNDKSKLVVTGNPTKVKEQRFSKEEKAKILSKFCTRCGARMDEAAGGGICAKCGAKLTPGAKFCPECGTPTQSVCPKCGAKLSGNAKFCPECGQKLK